MSAKAPKGRNAPENPIASSATALPPQVAGKPAATTLSGAFAAALGAKPQMSHSGPAFVPGARGAGKPPVEEAGAPRIKNSKPGAPALPRTGHR